MCGLDKMLIRVRMFACVYITLYLFYIMQEVHKIMCIFMLSSL